MKPKKVIPILFSSILSTTMISSCDSNEVKITYKLVYIEDGIDILEDRNYSMTLLYEKNHVYSEDDYELVYYQMRYYYYESGAPYSCYETMSFGSLYLYENNEYTYDEDKKLEIGFVFKNDATYVCQSIYNPKINVGSNETDISIAC